MDRDDTRRPRCFTVAGARQEVEHVRRTCPHFATGLVIVAVARFVGAVAVYLGATLPDRRRGTSS